MLCDVRMKENGPQDVELLAAGGSLQFLNFGCAADVPVNMATRLLEQAVLVSKF